MTEYINRDDMTYLYNNGEYDIFSVPEDAERIYVDIVRCKDCKYNPMSLHEPDHMKESYVHCFSFEENDYCSWAERKEE